MTLYYFGLLRASEFSVPDNQPFNVSMHLTMVAVALEQLTDKTGVLNLELKGLKLIKIIVVLIFIGCIGDIVCLLCHGRISRM